jgi:hypothetical protein
VATLLNFRFHFPQQTNIWKLGFGHQNNKFSFIVFKKLVMNRTDCFNGVADAAKMLSVCFDGLNGDCKIKTGTSDNNSTEKTDICHENIEMLVSSMTTIFSAEESIENTQQQNSFAAQRESLKENELLLSVQHKPRRTILKVRSRYPKLKTIEDEPPLPLIVSGIQRVDLTRDKHGNIIPFKESFWFANCEYERNALDAVILQFNRRKRHREEAEAESLRVSSEALSLPTTVL